MPLLLSMTEQALDRWDRIRRYFFRDVFVARIEQAQQEHHAILQAMREQDKVRIAHLLEQHNRQALASYLAYLDRKTSESTGVVKQIAKKRHSTRSM